MGAEAGCVLIGSDGASMAIDNDDGSSYYKITSNFEVYGGHKVRHIEAFIYRPILRAQNGPHTSMGRTSRISGATTSCGAAR